MDFKVYSLDGVFVDSEEQRNENMTVIGLLAYLTICIFYLTFNNLVLHFGNGISQRFSDAKFHKVGLM